MIWGHALNAARRVVAGIASPACYLRRKLAPTSGPAKITFRSVRPAGKPESPRVELPAKIARRAQRVCNRKASLASIYEARHAILARGSQ